MEADLNEDIFCYLILTRFSNLLFLLRHWSTKLNKIEYLVFYQKLLSQARTAYALISFKLFLQTLPINEKNYLVLKDFEIATYT